MCIGTYNLTVGRTNVVINDRLLAKAMKLYGFRTKRETIDFALRRLVGRYRPEDMLELEGLGWGGDLEAMRRKRYPDE